MFIAMENKLCGRVTDHDEHVWDAPRHLRIGFGGGGGLTPEQSYRCKGTVVRAGSEVGFGISVEVAQNLSHSVGSI